VTVRIDRAGREYVSWPITAAPSDAAALEFTFDDETTWHAATWNGDKTAATLLIAGPDITSVDGQVTLPVGRYVAKARLVDNPETVVRTSPAAIEVC